MVINYKKGSEKPIEIFVALFVILAVAMVLLRMFSGQIADKGAQLEDFAERQNAEALCTEVCSNAKTNGCRTEDLIRFCTKNFRLDLDQNSELGENNEFPTALCEDKIYCPLVSSCSCGTKLSMSACIELTKKFYEESENINSNQIQDLLDSKYKYTDGSCSDVPDSSWTVIYGGGHLTSSSE